MDGRPQTDSERITLAHGSGGALMHELIGGEFLKHFDSPELALLDDAAEIVVASGRLAFSTDTFVVKPFFFPGGDIGSLAVSGTVNDVLMKGARPLCLSLAFVIEEGFTVGDLRRILKSIGETAKAAGAAIVTGDTKVVGAGEIDGLSVNTAGIGVILPDIRIGGANARHGDAVIVSGDIGRHGIAVMAERNGLALKEPVLSDAAPLTNAVLPLLERFGPAVHVLRDPTRGGLAATLNEIALSSRVSVVLEEEAVPVARDVGAVCEILGFDPFHLPCEGRFLVFVDGDSAEDTVAFLKESCGCPDAAVIGTVERAKSGEVLLTTVAGGRRILDMPVGELLPRIC